MSEALKAGDLAMVVRACCADDETIGHIYILGEPYEGPAGCHVCHRDWNMVDGFSIGAYWCAERHWLKRIPPLEELQTFRQTDETTV